MCVCVECGFAGRRLPSSSSSSCADRTSRCLPSQSRLSQCVPPVFSVRFALDVCVCVFRPCASVLRLVFVIAIARVPRATSVYFVPIAYVCVCVCSSEGVSSARIYKVELFLLNIRKRTHGDNISRICVRFIHKKGVILRFE